jgi:Flp pilus assembly protein TadG
MRRMSRFAPADERGAVALLTAFFAVVMVVMAALVVDVGSLHDERRQLQNGADAAALAIAHSCAEGACPGDPKAFAADYANGNALDGAATVMSAVTDMPGKKVTVQTRTRSKAGDTILPHFFAQAFSGKAGDTVSAKATATWTGIGRATVIPLVISACEWDQATSAGKVFDKPITVYFHAGSKGGGKKSGYCDAPAGQDTDGDQRLAGGFGWVTSTDCKVNIASDTNIEESADPGTSAPKACEARLQQIYTEGEIVLVPIFDDLWNTGSNGMYHIYGFAEFRLTGYRFPSISAGVPKPPCNSGDTCLGGYFTRYVSAADAAGGPDLGARTVKLVS